MNGVKKCGKECEGLKIVLGFECFPPTFVYYF